MAVDCPFCPFSDHETYFLMQHVELCHPENGESPFMVKEGAGRQEESGNDVESTSTSDVSSEDEEYIECECGESVVLKEFESHTELHRDEGMALDEGEKKAANTAASRNPLRAGYASISTTDGMAPVSLSNINPSQHNPLDINTVVKHRSRSKDTKQRHGVNRWKGLLLGTSSSTGRPKTAKDKHRSVRRLGRAELGPHAYEERMPEWLHKQLELGAKVTILNQLTPDGRMYRVETVANETRGILPVLAQLCEQDRHVSRGFICHPDVQHVVKMAKEGGFCGYRNIQMMISFIQGARSEGHQYFPARVPSILQLQELIENAWDKGINDTGRIETGGIRGTRKYIGTPEARDFEAEKNAQALLVSLGIGCEASAFNDRERPPVYGQVLEAVEQYFMSGVTDASQKVARTSLPPLYFQHPGHSLTIIGLEIRKSGCRNLLILDPMFKPSPGIHRLIGNQIRASQPEKLLKAYRRGESYLGKHKCFEVLKLTARLPPGAGWNAA